MADYGKLVARAMEALTSSRAAPIRGLPQTPLQVGDRMIVPAPSAELRNLAEDYMRATGRPYQPVENYVPIDVERAKAIAKAYEDMPHAPHDPTVQRSYDALAKETRDQYEVLKRLGVKIEPMPAGIDPYAATPRLANRDYLENRHFNYFPTEGGYGSGQVIDTSANPLLQPSGVKIAGREVPYNDLFRIVHDFFGHFKEGLGFRAAGEENAWRSHSRMYSDAALPAMTAELRGQNSWLNYGPHGEANRSAKAADTIFAPQKSGVMPPWAVNLGRLTPLGVAGAATLPELADQMKSR